MTGGIMEKAGYEHKTANGGGLKYYLENGWVPYPIPEGEFLRAWSGLLVDLRLSLWPG